jgi:hypothetical protein
MRLETQQSSRKRVIAALKHDSDLLASCIATKCTDLTAALDLFAERAIERDPENKAADRFREFMKPQFETTRP